MSPRWRLILAAAAFLGWMTWLGATALTRSRGPIVSQAQAAAARYQIVAEVKAEDGKPVPRVAVVESPTAGGPAAGTEVYVGNLIEVTGFDGPGRYLLLVTDHPFLPMINLGGETLASFTLVGPQRSPGNDFAGAGKPLVYRWTDDVRKQAERLRR